ncbi:MAG TPA: DUF885 domain-containing protein [Rhodothermales bacterium]|nr:DUF885 domain-containing protein [Rhodothermales bacterium]
MPPSLLPKAIMLAAVFLQASMSGAVAQTPAHTLHALFDEAWAAEQEWDPLAATNRGNHDFNHRLPDVSPAALQSRHQARTNYLGRLQAIDRSQLDEEDRLNYDLFEFRLEQGLSEDAFQLWRIPFNSDSGFHTEVAQSVEATRFESVADYEAYLLRLAAIPQFVDQQIANMRQGLADGFTQPKRILGNVEPTFAALAVESPERSEFWKPFDEIPESIAGGQAEVLRDRGRDVLEGAVLGSFSKLHAFFRDEYIPGARTTIGATDLPNGAEYYQERIRRFTTLDLKAEDIHQLGIEEAGRIRSEMQAIIEEVGFEGTFSEFLHFLRTDPQFYAKSPHDLMLQAAWIAKRTDEKMPAFFGLRPRTPYGVRAVPDEIAPNYTTGRYWPPIHNVRGGLFMVNTYALDKRPLYNLPALALHEGVPGHHHQVAIAQELENVPSFRAYTYIDAFGEGWGLYCEKLGEEMGIYTTPYERFGRLTYEMWRAGRLIVDTGMHAMGWTRQQAVDFYLENSALAEHNINTEVDRYISWPGQALAYKIGELKILELRAKAEASLGDRFDIRSFHDAVLQNGALPLAILEEQVGRATAGL